ncbi:MAG TPA: OmpW family outer membrane protein [Thermoanaerobaculia bacterium]|nr:OmpW family outer membrane protein [Thermoanaerobaculia bacterium]
MKAWKAIVPLLVLLVSTSAWADGHTIEVTGWGSYVTHTGDVDTGGSPLTIDFDSGGGAGLSIDCRFHRLLTFEVAAFFLRTRGELDFGGVKAGDLGYLDMVPLQALIQIHPAGDGPVDPYFGVGGAYVIFQNLHNVDLDRAGIGVVSIDNRFALVANAGLAFRITPHVSIALDGRYMPLKADSTSAAGGSQELKLNPLVASAGFRVKF